MNITLLILNIIALVITIKWAVESKDFEPLVGTFTLIGTLISLILNIIKPKLKIFYIIEKIGESRSAGGPWREEFRIIIGLKNKNSYKSATNVSLKVLSEIDYFSPSKAESLSINPKAELEILSSKRYIIIKDSLTYRDIKIDYELSASEIKSFQKTIIITGEEIIKRVLKVG